jgi:hypothetical protein
MENGAKWKKMVIPGNGRKWKNGKIWQIGEKVTKNGGKSGKTAFLCAFPCREQKTVIF